MSGLRYLYTNATAASQPVGGDVLAWGAVDGTTNATQRDIRSMWRVRRLHLPAPSSFAGWSSIINGGVVADNNGTHVGGTIRGENRKAEIVLPSTQSSPLMTRESQSVDASTAGNMTPMTLSDGGGGFGNGGFGGGGGGGAGAAPTARRAVGGKQVELAAAAPRPAQTAAPTSPVSVGAKFVDVKDDSRKLGFDWYLEKVAATNGAVVALNGTTPAAPGAIDRVGSVSQPNIVKDQFVDQAKELRVAQAEWERLRQENGDHSIPHVHGPGNVASPSNVNDATIVGYVNIPSNTNADYVAAEKELNEATQWRQILALKAGEEKVDASLPKARMVSVMNLATAEEAGKPALGEKIKQTLTGKVERTASIQVEQEHPDIGGLGRQRLRLRDTILIFS